VNDSKGKPAAGQRRTSPVQGRQAVPVRETPTAASALNRLRADIPATAHPGSKRGYRHAVMGAGNTFRAVTSQRRRSPGRYLPQPGSRQR
jgi:hypothetical protein